MVVANGPVKITDFGIARRRVSSELTQTGMLMGSPKYMSPEQVIGKRADHRSDIFSLGIIVYEMLTGTAPFNGENVTALMYQTVNFVPPSPSQINSAVPALLDHIVAKMIAKPLEERYQDAAEAARDLRECERQAVASATTVPPAGTTTLLAATVPAATVPAASPTLMNAEAKSVVMAQTVKRTRQVDQPAAPDAALSPTSTVPAQGLAKAFDSAEATQRLATLTGAAGTLPPEVSLRQTATQAVRSLPEPRAVWRRRDWALVAGAALCGLLAALLFR
jgi:serine/threonine-protein kinase